MIGSDQQAVNVMRKHTLVIPWRRESRPALLDSGSSPERRLAGESLALGAAVDRPPRAGKSEMPEQPTTKLGRQIAEHFSAWATRGLRLAAPVSADADRVRSGCRCR
jgi:hypothetical protein